MAIILIIFLNAIQWTLTLIFKACLKKYLDKKHPRAEVGTLFLYRAS